MNCSSERIFLIFPVSLLMIFISFSEGCSGIPGPPLKLPSFPGLIPGGIMPPGPPMAGAPAADRAFSRAFSVFLKSLQSFLYCFSVRSRDSFISPALISAFSAGSIPLGWAFAGMTVHSGRQSINSRCIFLIFHLFWCDSKSTAFLFTCKTISANELNLPLYG